jgi:hypothetical protein
MASNITRSVAHATYLRTHPLTCRGPLGSTARRHTRTRPARAGPPAGSGRSSRSPLAPVGGDGCSAPVQGELARASSRSVWGLLGQGSSPLRHTLAQPLVKACAELSRTGCSGGLMKNSRRCAPRRYPDESTCKSCVSLSGLGVTTWPVGGDSSRPWRILMRQPSGHRTAPISSGR